MIRFAIQYRHCNPIPNLLVPRPVFLFLAVCGVARPVVWKSLKSFALSRSQSANALFRRNVRFAVCVRPAFAARQSVYRFLWLSASVAGYSRLEHKWNYRRPSPCPVLAGVRSFAAERMSHKVVALATRWPARSFGPLRADGTDYKAVLASRVARPFRSDAGRSEVWRYDDFVFVFESGLRVSVSCNRATDFNAASKC